MKREAYRLGLTGFPLSHSLSPKLHTAALKAAGLEGSYSLFPVDPARPDELAHLLGRVRSGEIHGLNVTIPHKQAVLSLLDELSETAKAIGAVNTIYAQNGRLIGDNTDAAGFWEDLSPHLPSPKFQRTEFRGGTNLPLPHFRVSKMGEAGRGLVLGSGGSARAVVFALKAHGWDVAVAARRIEQAQALVTEFGLQAAQSLDSQTTAFELLVNTTPLGMSPNIETCAWDWGFPLRAFVYDLVYNPPETLLMKRARAAGLQASNGLGMLIEQAALAFELWTGHPADRTAMRESI
ncbi:MAG: shikimate dehydrogenase [Anaerolineae bacterium]|nr:shikimate dehydrogenase [Anaerolineae bacterium]